MWADDIYKLNNNNTWKLTAVIKHLLSQWWCKDCFGHCSASWLPYVMMQRAIHGLLIDRLYSSHYIMIAYNSHINEPFCWFDEWKMTSFVESILQNIVCTRDYATYLRNAPLVVRNICEGIGEPLATNHSTCKGNPDKYHVNPFVKPAGRAEHQRDNTLSQTESGTKELLAICT